MLEEVCPWGQALRFQAFETLTHSDLKFFPPTFSYSFKKKLTNIEKDGKRGNCGTIISVITNDFSHYRNTAKLLED